MTLASVGAVSAQRPPVALMAELIQALLDGGQRRLRDSDWLRERAEMAGLDPDECGTLEALRLRLRDGLPLLAEWPAVSWY